MEQRHYNILVTGGCGFIGWNFIRNLYKSPYISFDRSVNVDKLSYASINPEQEEYYDDRYVFIRKDIGKITKEFLKRYKIDLIFNFAANTHVDNSINSSSEFIQDNIVGMHNLMDSANQYWKEEGIDGKFILVSTDEVMGSVEDNKGMSFTEETPYHPNNPYSASKASAELLLKSYVHTHNFPGIITRCSNNYGPGQHEEKMIPKAIKCFLEGKKIPIYGDGLQKRDWIYVDDHCDGIIRTALAGNIGEIYNFGTNKPITNLDLIVSVYSSLNNKFNLNPIMEYVEFVSDRPGHDRTYAMDYSKSQKEFGWYPKTYMFEGLDKTIDYYLNKK